MIEVAASYFFRRALEPRKGRKAEQIDQDYRDAAHLAVLAAPFRHSKLTATKILGDPNNPVHFRDDATAEELRAEIMKRLEILISAGLIDLQALPAPAGGIANQPIPGVDQSGINGE
jgi:hypothetical protein